MIPFDDKGFENSVDTVLKPWLKEQVKGGTFSSFDGTRIQYYSAVRKDANAVIVMVHGFAEFFGKFHETAYNFWESGYTVFFIEQRGHGGSGRTVPVSDVVDVAGFSNYVDDLKCFLDKVVIPQTPGVQTRSSIRVSSDNWGDINISFADSGEENAKIPAKNLILYAHSMGGCVGTLFLERYPEYFCAAVLSSPMLKMTFGKTPLWQVKLMLAPGMLPGMGKKPVPVMNAFNPDNPNFEASGASSMPRFMYQFRMRKDPSNGGIYTMNRGTYRWVRAALKATEIVSKREKYIRIPLLVCQAGKDAYVDNEGQNEIAANARYVKLVQFPESEHEIYAGDPESLRKYYRELLRFFDKASMI